MTKKNSYTVKYGLSEVEAADGYSIARLLADALTVSNLPDVTVVSKKTGNIHKVLGKDLVIRVDVEIDGLENFIKNDVVTNYKPRPFSSVFILLFKIKQDAGEYRLNSYRKNTELDKLVRAGFLSVEKRQAKATPKATHNSHYNYFKTTTKANALLEEAKNLPSKKINPDIRFWHALIERIAERVAITTTLDTLLTIEIAEQTGLIARQAPDPNETRVAPLYSDNPSNMWYLTPKGEAAFLRKISDVVRHFAKPVWARDYKNKTRTLRPPSKLCYLLASLIPTKEISVLLNSGSPEQASYIKDLIEGKPILARTETYPS